MNTARYRLFVVVLSDTVAGVLDLETQTSVDPHLGQTVDDLFAFIQDAIDRPAQWIHAEYDPLKGFPTAIDYDGAALIADDEISFRASDVHPISPPPGSAPWDERKTLLEGSRTASVDRFSGLS